MMTMNVDKLYLWAVRLGGVAVAFLVYAFVRLIFGFPSLDALTFIVMVLFFCAWCFLFVSLVVWA